MEDRRKPLIYGPKDRPQVDRFVRDRLAMMGELPNETVDGSHFSDGALTEGETVSLINNESQPAEESSVDLNLSDLAS